MNGGFLGLALATPLAMALALLVPWYRARVRGLLVLAPVPALLAALFCVDTALTLPPALLRLRLELDLPGAILLGTAALLWIAGGAYAAADLENRPNKLRFVGWWLLTLAGSLGVFMAADLVGFYLLFSLVSLAALGLVVSDGTQRARRVGTIYVGLALLGEAFLLMAFVMLAQGAPADGGLIRATVAALPASPWRVAIMVLLIAGFGVKLGMVPFHVWMPLTYRVTPIPAAAVLSGAAVKAGVIGLIRFLPLDVAMPDWGQAMVVLGLVSAFYGVGVGIVQAHPKTILACSSISQMGVVMAVMGLGLAQGGGAAGIALIVAFYGAHHTLVKGGLFLAIGARMNGVAAVLAPAAILALGMAGLPLTGGALAKLMLKDPAGYGLVAVLFSLSSAGTAMLMIHFLRRLAAIRPADPVVTGVAWTWWGIAIAAVVVPWGLYLSVIGGSAGDVTAPATLWKLTWPLLVGGVLAACLARWGHRLPAIPEGDIVRLFAGDAVGLARRVGVAAERLDSLLRQWVTASLALLAIAALLLVLLSGGR